MLLNYHVVYKIFYKKFCNHRKNYENNVILNRNLLPSFSENFIRYVEFYRIKQ